MALQYNLSSAVLIPGSVLSAKDYFGCVCLFVFPYEFILRTRRKNKFCEECDWNFDGYYVDSEIVCSCISVSQY